MQLAIHIAAGILFGVVFILVTTELATTEEGQALLGSIGFLIYCYIATKAGWIHESD